MIHGPLQYFSNSLKDLIFSRFPNFLGSFSQCQIYILPHFLHFQITTFSHFPKKLTKYTLKVNHVWFFVSFRNFFFRRTQELEYYFFFCRAKRDFFPQNLTLGYMTKTLKSDYFFSSTKIRIFFSATLGIRIFF